VHTQITKQLAAVSVDELQYDDPVANGVIDFSSKWFQLSEEYYDLLVSIFMKIF